MKRTVNVLSKLNWGTRACAVLVLCTTTAIALPAQVVTLYTGSVPKAGARTALPPPLGRSRPPMGTSTGQP
jgi:hypothetical protein